MSLQSCRSFIRASMLCSSVYRQNGSNCPWIFRRLA